LSGNHSLFKSTEDLIATFHNSEAALIFNSGYDANIGFFSSVPQRGDIVLYDELCHASIRDGIKMSNAKGYKFTHNNVEDLEKKLHQFSNNSKSLIDRNRNLQVKNEIYIITESVFSMDGDTPDLKTLSHLCNSYNVHLVVDEAHALGVFGNKGEGLVQELELENKIFARIITFGKGLGCHGAAIICSNDLKNYLINFARSFIYTTALPPHSLATIQAAYNELNISSEKRQTLKSNIAILKNEIISNSLQQHFIPSNSAIHSCIVSGNSHVKHISEAIKKQGFDVKAILSPTVPREKERLRICLHSYNTKEQIVKLITIITNQIN